MPDINDLVRLPDLQYEYQHAPVPGGGFVTGFIFHPKEQGILYARTDIGGVYRYDFENKKWLSLMDHVTAVGKWESYPISIAIDENNPSRLYIASGDGSTNNFLCRSEDKGLTFDYFPLPAGVHGNAPGRGTGERLIVDPYDENTIYIGTQTKGLFVSSDRGQTWRKLEVKPDGGLDETNISFVWLDPRSGGSNSLCKTIVVSTSGQDNSPGGNVRGKSLYISFDGGETFQVMPGQPEPPSEGNYPGFVGQRAAFYDNKLYITMASPLYSWRGFGGYGCDMGGSQKGCVLRYEIPDMSDPTNLEKSDKELALKSCQKQAGFHRQVPIEQISCHIVTPNIYSTATEGISDCGFGGICADINRPGRLICATQCAGTDAVLITDDGGCTWRPLLLGLDIGKINFNVPYMKPKYNGDTSLIHWLSDIKIDPFDSNRALFNTGTGIFMTENLAEDGAESIWAPSCDGLEETVHLNVYSPPDGDKQLIDIIGDLGGFAFSDITKPAENSFADENGNRYITCLNADYPDNNPRLVVVTARGNWKGKTTGGLILSEDQCDTWTRLSDPVGISDEIDRLISAIRRPNTNSGWTTISADGETCIWCVADGNILPSDCVVFTENRGRTWSKVKLINTQGDELKGLTLKVISDRINPSVFYGFGDDSQFYVSKDKGRTFRQIIAPVEFPKLLLGGIDGRMPAEIRAESGKNVVWIATGSKGLWRIDFSSQIEKPEFTRITPEGFKVFRQGMGRPEIEGGCKTLYINGILWGEYGFWRSCDEGKSFSKINARHQMYGDIRSITGDPRNFGRIYIATGSRGVLWGEPVV